MINEKWTKKQEYRANAVHQVTSNTDPGPEERGDSTPGFPQPHEKTLLPPFLSYIKWTIKCDWTLQGRLVISKLRCEMPDICRHLELLIQDVVEVGRATNTQLGKDTSGMHCSFKILWSSFNFFPHRTSSMFYTDSTKNTVSWSHETQLSNLGPNPDIQQSYVPSLE